MVGKWSVKNPLTLSERIKIKEGILLGMCYREIAEHVNRHKSVVMREAKRLGPVEDYDAYKAQAHFERKQKEKRSKK